MSKRLSVMAAWGRLRACAFAACLVMVGWMALAPSPAQAQASCSTGACVSVGPRLASVDSSRGALLNLLLQALLPGSSVNVGVLDWDALAKSDINLNLLLLQLQNDLGVSSTQEVLDTDLTLSQLRLAMLQLAQADGNTALVNALNVLQVPLGPLVGTLRLGELLEIDFPQGALADINLDVLDLLVGSVQLYNYRNVLTTPSPVVVDTAALGLSGLARLSLWAQVVEPPLQTCGPTGSSFHTAAIRIKLDLQLADGINLQPLLDALGGLTFGLTNIQLDAGLLELEVYADVARSEGSIGALDLLSDVVTLQARPGLVGLYVGEIADATFFNRSQTITNAVVAPIRATELDLRFNVGLDLPLLGGLLNATVRVPLGVDLRAAATGAPALRSVTATPPFPRTLEVPCGSVCAGDLVVDLLQNLDIDVVPGTVTATVTVPILGTVSVDLPLAILDAIVGALEGALRNVLVPLLQPLLQLLLGNLVDPLLGLLGVHVGEMVVSAEGLLRHCPTLLRLVLEVLPPTHPGRFDLSIAQAGSVLVAQAAAADGDAIELADAASGEDYDLAAVAAAGTEAGHFAPTWRCTDQDDVEYAAGIGDSFSLEVPEGTTSALTVTCVLNQRQLTADLSLTKDNGVDGVLAGGSGTYVIRVHNAGPDAVEGAALNDPLPPGVSLSEPWRCEASPGSSCHAASGGEAGDTDPIQVLLDLAVDGEATITVPVHYSINLADFN